MAKSTKLELRDLEILRALLRVRSLTGRQLNATFFTCPRRRRIHRLSEYDLIRPHAKIAPDLLAYQVWRLTRRGLDALVHEFPDEVIPDGVLERIANGRLRHIFHHEALAELYLRVIVPEPTGLTEPDLGAHRRWVGELRARASSITWQPDGDVVLRASSLGGRVDVVPDAVVRSPDSKRRVFVELDRSTKNLGRILDGLERYRTVLRDTDLDGDVATVQFVVRSAARKANIERLGRQPFQLVVMQTDEAVEWLRSQLLAVATPPSPTTEPNLWLVICGIWHSRAGRYRQGCFNTTADADGASRLMTLANLHVPSGCLFMTLIPLP